MHGKLNRKQQRFVEEYLIDLNATQAALRAGYSQKTSKSIGVENLTKPAIKAAVDAALAARSEKTNITAARVLTEAACIAFSDPASAFELNGLPKPLHEMPEATRRAISSLKIKMKRVKVSKGRGKREEIEMVDSCEIRFHNKSEALDRLMKHLGMYREDRVVLDTENALAALLARVQGTTLRPVPQPAPALAAPPQGATITPKTEDRTRH